MISPAFALVSGAHLQSETANYDCVSTANLFNVYYLNGVNTSGGDDCSNSGNLIWSDLANPDGDYLALEVDSFFCPPYETYSFCLADSISQSAFSLSSLPVAPHSFTGDYSFAGGVASVSSAVFADFGSGGLLELIIGIFLGLMLLDWVIGQFRGHKKENEHSLAHQN